MQCHVAERNALVAANTHAAQPSQGVKGDRTNRSPDRSAHSSGKQSNAMNEEPDDGKLRGFADADLIRRRRSLFNFAQASSLPIPNQYAEKQKGRLK